MQIMDLQLYCAAEFMH